jgi:hypothetical protein
MLRFEVVVTSSSSSSSSARIVWLGHARAAQLNVVIDEAVLFGLGVLAVADDAPVEEEEEDHGEGADGDAAYQGGLVNHCGWLD